MSKGFQYRSAPYGLLWGSGTALVIGAVILIFGLLGAFSLFSMAMPPGPRDEGGLGVLLAGLGGVIGWIILLIILLLIGAIIGLISSILADNNVVSANKLAVIFSTCSFVLLSLLPLLVVNNYLCCCAPAFICSMIIGLFSRFVYGKTKNKYKATVESQDCT
jgi:hypothetical protein